MGLTSVTQCNSVTLLHNFKSLRSFGIHFHKFICLHSTAVFESVGVLNRLFQGSHRGRLEVITNETFLFILFIKQKNVIIR